MRNKSRSERNQLELFRALPGDLALRGARDFKARPFFWLAKSKLVVPINFCARRNLYSRRSGARAKRGDDLGCRCPDLGSLANCRGARCGLKVL